MKMTQRMQAVVQNDILSPALKSGNAPLKTPLIVRLVAALPFLQAIPADFIGVGARAEHVHSPIANAP